MFSYCDYCGNRIGIFNLHKKSTGKLVFCSAQCRNRFMRDNDTKNFSFSSGNGRPFENDRTRFKENFDCRNQAKTGELVDCGACMGTGIGATIFQSHCKVCGGSGKIRV